MQQIGKMFVVFGVVIAAAGLALMFSDKVPFLGKLPGDIDVKRDNFHLYFPIASSVIISLVLTAILWIVYHFKGK